MANIKKLSEFVANQIAAGEVVIGPASVTKELIENAIDADSSVVVVRIVDGGQTLIQVIDEGLGMSSEDSVQAFERHATSKISNVNDIFNITTYGFRGEALPSIASVSELEMLSRRAEDEVGTRVVIHGGAMISNEEVICPVGTQFVVKNLFYNLPARKKFMKSATSDTNAVTEEFLRVALCYPDVSFFLYNGDDLKYSLPVSSLRGRVGDIIDKKKNSGLLELYLSTSMVEIRGYIGKPEIARKRSEQYMFVNGRYFGKRAFHKAIQLGYDKLLPSSDTMPPYFMYFTVDPDKIDVNIHPSKTEVKFENEQDIWQMINAAVRETLGKNGIVPMIDFEAGSGIDIPLASKNREVREPGIDVNMAFNPFDESFSFSGAVGGDTDSFRKSITKGALPEVSTSEFISPRSSSASAAMGFDMMKGSDNYSVENEDAEIEVYNDVELLVDIIPEEEAVQPLPLSEKLAEGEVGRLFVLRGKYIVTSYSGTLLLVDINNALSRINFEKINALVDNDRTLPTQKLLFETDIDLSIPDTIIIAGCLDELELLGFTFDFNESEHRIIVSGIPAEAGAADAATLFEELLASIKMNEIYDYKQSRRQRLIVGLATACGTKRGKYSLSDEEAKYIVKELLACKSPAYAADGKRVFATLSVDDIVKILK